MSRRMQVIITDPDAPGGEGLPLGVFDIRASSVMLLDLDNRQVTFLADRIDEIDMYGLTRQVWATRLRHWSKRLRMPASSADPFDYTLTASGLDLSGKRGPA